MVAGVLAAGAAATVVGAVIPKRSCLLANRSAASTDANLEETAPNRSARFFNTSTDTASNVEMSIFLLLAAGLAAGDTVVFTASVVVAVGVSVVLIPNRSARACFFSSVLTGREAAAAPNFFERNSRRSSAVSSVSFATLGEGSSPATVVVSAAAGVSVGAVIVVTARFRTIVVFSGSASAVVDEVTVVGGTSAFVEWLDVESRDSSSM